jgi:hypothetical protein
MAADGRSNDSRAVDVLLAVASLLTLLYAWVYYPLSQGLRGDFLAALSHRDGKSAYWNGEGIGYGPIFALYDLMLRPFHDLPALRLMYVINLVLLAATFVILLRTFLPAPRTRRETLVALFAWSSFYPLAQLIRQDDIEITELFFLSLFLLYLTRRSPLRAGAALGMAASAKLIPIFLVPYLAWRRQWKAVAATLGTFAAMIVLIAVVKGFGPATAIEQWRQTGHAVWPNEWNNNQAFSGFFWRMFSVAHFTSDVSASYPQVLHPHWAGLATLAASIAAMAATALLFIRREGIWPRPARDATVEVSEAAIVFTVILLALPHCHTHYFGLIVWIYFIALRAMTREDLALDARTQWAFVISFVLAGLLMPLRLADPLIRRKLPVSLVELWKLYSLPFIGILVALFALAAVHRAQIARQSPPA